MQTKNYDIMKKKIQENENKIEELIKQKENLEIELNKMLNSKSWKITEPIRKLRKKIQNN